MKKDTKALIKDLELQIDYLIGYETLGLSWQQEFYARNNMIEEFLNDDNVPNLIKEKVYRIQQSLDNMRNNRVEQSYSIENVEETIEEFRKEIIDEEISNIDELIQKIDKKIEEIKNIREIPIKRGRIIENYIYLEKRDCPKIALF